MEAIEIGSAGLATPQTLNNMETIEKIYFSISEVSSKLKISQSKIRYYLDFFDLPVKRTNRGSRKFTQSDIFDLDLIIQKVDEGFHLKAIKKNYF